MTRPIPILPPSRDLQTEPHESEPTHGSYDPSSYDAAHSNNPLAWETEDKFHQRLQARRSGGTTNNTNGGTSFWRTSKQSPGGNTVTGNIHSGEDNQPQPVMPSFSSVSLKDGGSSGLLGAALQTHNNQSSNVNNEYLDDDGHSTRPSANQRRGVSNHGNTGSNRDLSKKHRDQQRRVESRLKRESFENEVEAGHPPDEDNLSDLGSDSSPPTAHSGGGGFLSDLVSSRNMKSLGGVGGAASLDRASSDQSTESILYGKAPNPAILAKTASLIFPTGVETTTGDRDGNVGGNLAFASGVGGSSSHTFQHINSVGSMSQESSDAKIRKINLLLDQCETVRFPFKKKLILSNLGITAAEIPLNYLCGTPLGNALHKLSLSGNHLGSIPDLLVQSLPCLKHLELSQCRLHGLPNEWNLPQLKKLNLSNNLLRDFPEETMLAGLPELQELDMFGNKITVIVVPHDPSVLSKLETLNLGYNDITFLPDELDQLRALRVLKVRNNFLTKIPMRICDMDLRSIEVSSNPISVPPLETCERGICSMKRFYQQVRMEDQSKGKAVEELHRRVTRGKNKKEMIKKYSGFMKTLNLTKSSTPSGHRKQGSSPSGTTAVSALAIAQTKVALSPGGKHVETYDDIPREALVKPVLEGQVSDETEAVAVEVDADEMEIKRQDITVNDTLKVIFVGMAMVGKTSMIKRLIDGKKASLPLPDERTVGVDICAWDPKKDKRFEHIDSRIQFEDQELAEACGDVDVKFSVWDFAGQHVYHATHELFFSSNALYVLVWDMGANNKDTLKRKPSHLEESGEFKLSYDSESEHENDCPGEDRSSDDFCAEEDARRADRALERDIDEKVQFWVDCIQSSAPGAAILPVASFADHFESEGGPAEAKRRCHMLKERLSRHEEQRLTGIERRLQELKNQNRADDPAAHRLWNLLCPSNRPKLIFGEGEEDCVVRVSGTQYSGFDRLTQKIVDIAAGRYRGNWPYPVFHGHVGARIPRMRLQVRDTVRAMRDRFKVVEWGYFINQVREHYNSTSVEDISDALHFLTSIGELSYFGSVMAMNNNSRRNGKSERSHPCKTARSSSMQSEYEESEQPSAGKLDNEDDFDDDAVLSIDETTITAPGTEDGSLSTVEDVMSTGLSQFVFLNPRWLVAAVACILRHDLDREIKETRRALEGKPPSDRAGTFQEASLNCPVITAEDAMMLWQAKRITKKAAERAQAYSNNMTITPLEFLQHLLIRFGVFVPIDLSIEKALLGGKEYARLVDSIKCSAATSLSSSSTSFPSEVSVELTNDQLGSKAKFFFLPSLLGPGEPNEAWTFKNLESWKTTLCHSVLFPDGVPPGLMERLTASVLSSIYAVSNRQTEGAAEANNAKSATYEGRLTVREVLCWRTAFFLKLGTVVVGEDGEQKESIVEIFCHLAERDSHLCVGSDYMAVGTRRIIVSGRGQSGNGGVKIWKGGYLLVCKCVTRVMAGYGGLEYEIQSFCPDCLAKKSVSEASWWDFTAVRAAVNNEECTIRCHHHGHVVDTRYVAGPVDHLKRHNPPAPASEPDPVSVEEMLGAVVLVGLWDGKTRKVVRAGSGFIVDRKRGLIVTAAHTLMHISGDSKYPFGEDYYGLQQGKVVIGVIPENEDVRSKKMGMAVFRYFAKIVAKDSSFQHGECHLDACVLRITTRMENDVNGNGEECGDQPEILLLNNEKAFRAENLKVLKISEKCELEEHVRIIGFNQGGEGLLGPGQCLNRFADFARGYVCKKFTSSSEIEGGRPIVASGHSSRDCFKPREEIAVICRTIGGHSGGPCVNQQGEVIGILSRADPADSQRCYLSPASEWKPLIKLAKKSDRNWTGGLG
ncbi:hypothetical protein ACA910_019138 [Epithemia clementina (nom. ined.)]